MYVARDAEGGGTGSARRRRERRLRAYLRYAQMSVAMALAETTHHSAQRQKKARAREEEREVHYTAAFRTTVPPPEQELFDLFEEPGGERPSLLLEPQGAQPGGQRHIVEQMADVAPMVQILDAPVPQKRIELVDILKCVDLQAPVEQVIDAPKVFLDCIQPRSVLRRPQTAEQLVEVPTIVSYSYLLQRTAEQIVDIPVPGRAGGGERGGLQGPPGQGSTALCEAEFVDTPVPLGLREESGGLQSFLPVQDSTAFCGADYVEQIVDIPVRGGLQGFLPGKASSSSRSRLVDEALEWGFFAHFFPWKKSAGSRAGGCAAGWARQLIHAERSSNGSCRSLFALEPGCRAV